MLTIRIICGIIFFLAEKDSLLKIGCSRGLECDFFMCLKFVQGAKMVGHISLQQKLIILEDNKTLNIFPKI